jgi:putative thioredoxin
MVDVTDATFQQAVIERSAIVPVVVDLWAEWCGPCKQLGPILEKVIAETQGKVDVDANPQIAQAFKVQSIPAVFALVNGQPVDQFMGALPEAEVAAFVNKLLPDEEETELSRLLSAGDESSLRSALELEPGNAEVIVALAELLVTDQQSQEALALLEKIPESPATRRVAALARTGSVGADQVATQLTELLETVKDNEADRQHFVDLLELMDDEDPAKAQWRRKLTAKLF